MDIEAADRAVAAGAVLDDELNVALRFDLGGDQPGEDVDAAARRHRNDDADGAIGKTGLRTQDARRQHEFPLPPASMQLRRDDS